MRFCPFCAHENADTAAQCDHCGRRLPQARRAGESAPVVDPSSAPRADSPASQAKTSLFIPKPNLPSRPVGLAPKSPLRDRVRSPGPPAAAPALAPTAPEPPTALPPRTTRSRPPETRAEDGVANPERVATRVPTRPPQTTPASRPPQTTPASRPPQTTPASRPPRTQPVADPQAVLPLPPPPGDFSGSLATPAAIRDVTGKAPLLSDSQTGQALVLSGAGPLTPAADSDTPGGAMPTPLARARTAAQSSIAWVRRTVDLQAVRYVFHAARDAVKKRAEIARLRKQSVAEQRKLDGVLSQLGRQARAVDLPLPALADEMRAAKTLEAEREAARGRIAELEKQRSAAEEQFRGVEAEKQSAIAAVDAGVAQLSDELAAKVSERAGHRAAMSRIESQLATLSRTVQSKEAGAVKAADPAEQGALRGEVDALRAQIGALEPEQEKLSRKASELEQPIADLETRLAAARDNASGQRRELGEAARLHKEATAQLHGQIDAEAQRATQSERELSLKFATLGTLLSLHRVDHPAFQPLYQELDAIKATIGELDSTIAALESQLKGYDRGQLQKGVVVIGVAVLLVIVLVAMIV
jgi:predicted  nucleic acid-binding Zn-ribbon protein